MLGRNSLKAVLLAGVILAASLAGAQGEAIDGIETQISYYVDGEITAVDLATHTVTIASDDGAVRTRDVSPTVTNFANARVGDNVSLSIEDLRTFILSAPEAGMPANWWVVRVDAVSDKITLAGPDSGPAHTYNVIGSSRRRLLQVKPGDRLTDISSKVAVTAIKRKPWP